MFNLMKPKAPPPSAGSPEFNLSIKYQINAMGDDGTASRHVVHYCYPEDDITAAKPEILQDIALSLGLSVKPAATAGGFVFEHRSEVATSMFDQLTTKLAEQLRDCGYDYDGWECAVVTQSF